MVGRRPDPREGPGGPAPIGRRAFLALTSAGLSSLLWGEPLVNALSGVTRHVIPESVRASLPGPSSGWRIYSVASPLPRFDPHTWRLRIDGLVEEPVELTYADLRGLPRARQVSDFHCVTGWSVDDVRWAGVRFADLLGAVRLSAGARAIEFHSAERPYVDSLTLDQVRSADAMLAYEMDGAPLTRPHGAPVRVVMPRMYGYKGVKWVQRMHVTSEPRTGYWESYGYDPDGWVGRSNGV